MIGAQGHCRCESSHEARASEASERLIFAYFPLFSPKKPVFLFFFCFFEVGKILYSQDSFSSLRIVPVSVFNEPNFFLNTATTALIDKRSRAKH